MSRLSRLRSRTRLRRPMRHRTIRSGLPAEHAPHRSSADGADPGASLTTMPDRTEAAALIALLRAGGRPWAEYADLVEEAGSAISVFEGQRAADPPTLFSDDRRSAHLEEIADEIDAWEAAGMRLQTVLDPGYPENLRSVHDRPPFVFVAGTLTPADSRAIAVVGARVASPHGVWAAGAIAEHLVDHGYTVVSGLAAGIDTAAHTAALARGGRSIAVIGTGLRRYYPPQHAGFSAGSPRNVR